MNQVTAVATRRATALALVILLFAAVLATPAPASSASDASVAIIVQTSDLDSTRSSVEAVGGVVTGEMAAIGALAATVPATRVSEIGDLHTVYSLAEDSAVVFAGDDHDRDGRDDDDDRDDWVDDDHSATTESTSAVTVGEVASIINADRAAAYGHTGEGITVALIDSGVAPLPPLSGRIVNGPDLSFDSQIPEMAHLDAYGHGTHMAGIIAGVAPGASILNVKVGSADGSVDVSQVLAGINWVIEHKDDNGMNVRVLNLSFGTDSAQAYEIDPLSYAVEAAWRNGIVVVVAGGNDGNSSRLRSPATNPTVIAVGAAETKGTESISDDSVPSFSNCGTSRTIDVVAPGRSIASLRVKGSKADVDHPTAVVSTTLFKGSGSSQAAAAVSATAALVLGAHPDYTPDQVKSAIVNNATSIRGTSDCQGAGMVLANRAVRYGASRSATQSFTPATGSGSLEAARGTDHLENEGSALVGEIDIFGNSFNGSTWTGSTWTGSTWTGGDWNGSTWTGSTWTGSTWTGSTWTGSTWTGSTWTGSTWTGAYWTGSTWTGSTWTGSTWTGSTWTGDNWTGLTWDHGKRIR